MNEMSRILLIHVGCTWLGVQGRKRLEISNRCGESTGKNRVVFRLVHYRYIVVP